MPQRSNSKLPILPTVAIAVAVVVLTVVYWKVTGDNEKTIIFLALSATAGATMVLSIYTAQGVREILRDRELRSREEQLRQTFDFGRRWNDPGMYHVRDVCKQVLSMHGRSAPGIEIANFATERDTNVGHVLNFLEELAFAKEYGIIDAEIARNQFEGVVIGLWQALEPWIQNRRRERRRPKIWSRFEVLYKEWSDR